jgi:DNA-directed RNA polymerase specialized sigma24 family protein
MTEIRNSRSEKLVLFETFIDQYYPSIFAGVQKLCGPVDKLVLEKLTVEIFVELWERHEELFRPLRKPAFIYKILVKHVIDYLKRQGADAQLRLLHDTLLLDPEQFM